MTEIYEFNVQIWVEDSVYKYSICQEFSNSEDEFEPIESGEANTLQEAAILVSEGVERHFKSISP